VSWTADQVRRVLESWPELASGARPHAGLAKVSRDRRSVLPWEIYSRLLVVDLERGLRELRGRDPAAFTALRVVYLDVAERCLPYPLRVAAAAAALDLSYRQTTVLLRRAILQLTEILNQG